jgi:hypothetical protein
MSRCARLIRHLCQLAYILLTLGLDALRVLRLGLRSPAALAAENLFLRKQLALYQERNLKPRRVTDATRCTLVWLSHPKRRDHGRAQRMQSQRWRTFMRNHVRGLIVSDAYEACIRSVHAMYGRIMQLLQSCGDGSHGRRSSPPAPQEWLAVARLDGNSAVRHVRLLRMAAVVSNVERSPPRLPWPVHVASLVCVPQMGAGPSRVCLVAQKSCGWIIITLSTRRVRPARGPGRYTMSLRRVA